MITSRVTAVHHLLGSLPRDMIRLPVAGAVPLSVGAACDMQGVRVMSDQEVSRPRRGLCWCCAGRRRGYEWSFQSHARMGPACAVVEARADQCDLLKSA